MSHDFGFSGEKSDWISFSATLVGGIGGGLVGGVVAYYIAKESMKEQRRLNNIEAKRQMDIAKAQAEEQRRLAKEQHEEQARHDREQVMWSIRIQRFEKNRTDLIQVFYEILGILEEYKYQCSLLLFWGTFRAVIKTTKSIIKQRI